MSEGIKWGEDLERDCAELKRLESYGLYPEGHHDTFCPLESHSDSPPAGPTSNLEAETEAENNDVMLPPREEITD